MIDIAKVTCGKLHINPTETLTSVTKKQIKLMTISISAFKQLISNVIYQPNKGIVSRIKQIADISGKQRNSQSNKRGT